MGEAAGDGMEGNGVHLNGRNTRRPVYADDPSLTLSRWQKAIFPHILSFAHFVFSLLTSCVIFSQRVHRHLKHLCSCLSRASYHFDALSLKKRPVHLAFVVNETSVDVPSLARLVGWCLESKIGCVSLYDHSGQIKGLHDSLVTSLVATATSSVHPTVEDEFKLVRVRNSARGEDSEVTYDPRNGSAEKVSAAKSVMLDISLLSAHDGKDDVCEAAASIARDVRSGHIRDIDTDIDVDLVASRLKTNRGMPDPDLMVRFGRTSSNMGFLPWQVRLTEIHDHPSHRQMDKTDFQSLLSKFSNCQQRFGK